MLRGYSGFNTDFHRLFVDIFNIYLLYIVRYSDSEMFRETGHLREFLQVELLKNLADIISSKTDSPIHVCNGMHT